MPGVKILRVFDMHELRELLREYGPRQLRMKNEYDLDTAAPVVEDPRLRIALSLPTIH